MLFFPSKRKISFKRGYLLKENRLIYSGFIILHNEIILFHLECLWCKPPLTSIHLPSSQLRSKEKKKEKNNFSHFSHSDSFMHLGYIQLIQVYFSSQLLAFPSIHSEDIVFPYDTKKNEQYSQMYWSFSLSCVDLIKV